MGHVSIYVTTDSYIPLKTPLSCDFCFFSKSLSSSSPSSSSSSSSKDVTIKLFRKRDMEKAMTTMSSIKVGSLWVSNKAKQEISQLPRDLSSLTSSVEQKAKWVFNKLKGKTQKELPDLLREHNLPAGIFPQNIVCYEFDELTSKLVVHMSSPCEVSFKDSSVLRYANRVKATLSRGKLSSIEGLKTKVIVWVKITGVSLESSKSDKLWFTAGVKKCRTKDAYEFPKNAVKVDEF